MEEKRIVMYYTYMLRCEDGSLYTGITVDVDRRMSEHFEQNEKCARYTLRHRAQKIEAVWQSSDRAMASKLEFRIKRLTRSQKEELIADNKLSLISSERIDAAAYKRIR